MRTRLLVLGAALGILALQWSRETGLSLAPSAAEPTEATLAAKPAPAAAQPTPWPGGSRDPFRFADPEPRGDVRSRAATQAVGEIPSPPPPASPSVRLVGLVRRSGGLQAALAADGEVALVSVGDRIGAFSVVSLDEEGSVRLRGLDGREVTLTLPEEP